MQYWNQADSSERGDPFSDRSGGLIVAQARLPCLGGDGFTVRHSVEAGTGVGWIPRCGLLRSG